MALHWKQAIRIDRLRKLAESGATEIRGWLDSQESPTSEWKRLELADLVRGTLAEMSAEYAELLAAKYLDDRSLQEIAQQSGCSIDATKSKLARARRGICAKFEYLAREPTPTENSDNPALNRRARSNHFTACRP